MMENILHGRSMQTKQSRQGLGSTPTPDCVKIQALHVANPYLLFNKPTNVIANVL